MKNVLRLNCGHHPATELFVDGELVATVEKERFDPRQAHERHNRGRSHQVFPQTGEPQHTLRLGQSLIMENVLVKKPDASEYQH